MESGAILSLCSRLRTRLRRLLTYRRSCSKAVGLTVRKHCPSAFKFMVKLWLCLGQKNQYREKRYLGFHTVSEDETLSVILPW